MISYLIKTVYLSLGIDSCRWLYWTDIGAKTIERVSMDGSNRTELHTTNLQTPYSLTIDYKSQTLYWADYSLNRLESSNADGSNRRLLTTTNIQGIYAMSFFAGNLYWTDWPFNGIHSAPSSTPNNATFLVNLGGDPYDIHIVFDEVQLEGNNEYFHLFQFYSCYYYSSKFMCSG